MWGLYHKWMVTSPLQIMAACGYAKGGEVAGTLMELGMSGVAMQWMGHVPLPDS